MGKEKKGKPKHKESVKVKKSKFYSVTGDEVTRKGKDCPKCGAGTFMGAHKGKDSRTRFACGNCGMTIWEWI